MSHDFLFTQYTFHPKYKFLLVEVANFKNETSN